MPFNETLNVFDELTTTHCSNFNEQNEKLLQNTNFNKQNIGDLQDLQTQSKQDLVSSINEVKNSITSSTNINTTIDQKIATHNASTSNHSDIRSQLSILSNDRGYLNSRKIANMSEISASGKYHANTKEVGINGIDASCSIDVTMENSGYGRAIATIHYTPQVGIDGTFFCTKLNGVWTAWKQLATSDEISILSANKADKNNGFNGVLMDTIAKPSDMNSMKTPLNYETVWDTTGILNFPNVTRGITRLRFKVEKLVNDMVRQEIEFQVGAVSYGIWYRSYIDGGWQEWKQLATTDKIDILMTQTSELEARIVALGG